MKKSNVRLVGTLIALSVGGASLTSCQSTGFASSLTLTGAETQRDLAVDVRRTLESQESCQTEAGRAFELLNRLQRAEAEEVADLYADLQDQVDTCAERVRKSGVHIDELRYGGTALFASWSAELEEFVSPGMRARSEERMHDAQRALDDVLAGLERTQVQMEEVLMLQRDYVLFFNHNLSAHSIESLKGENAHFEDRMRMLAKELTKVRRTADTFIVELHGAPATRADS